MANKRITDVDIINSLDGGESFFVNKNNAIKQVKKENVVFGIINGGTGATNASSARENLGAAAKEHKHDASDITGTMKLDNMPTISIGKGGTGATDAKTARENLGAAATTHKHNASDITGTMQLDNMPTISIEKGGTGATTASGARLNLDLNYKMYSSMEQLNLSGAMTTVDVFAAMPNNSVLLISNNKESGINYLSDVPVTFGAVELRKDVSWGCAKVTRVSSAVPEFYEANWSTSNGFSGWHKMISFTAGETVVSEYQYGDTLPSSGSIGRIFFKKG